MTPASTVPSGFLGNLSADQESRLLQFWNLLLHLTEASSLGALEQIIHINSRALDLVKSTSSASPSPSRRNSLFSRTESRLSHRDSKGSFFSVYHAHLLQTFRDVGLSTSELRSVRRFLSCMSPEDVRFGLFTAAKHEPPDVYLLRYLRMCKWDVNKALVLLLNSLVWRLKEMQVDNVLLSQGELYAAQHEHSHANRYKAELSRGFISQLRMGKCYVHGTDRMNRPVCVVRMRLHQPGAQSEEALNQFIAHTMESIRLLISPPVEASTHIFDMTGFSLANMEYAPLKFIIRCFETYYPESLGVLLVHNAPRVFAGIWKIIKTWMDPSLVAKIHFTRTTKDLERFIARDQIISELGGTEDWEYEYPEPEVNENHRMSDYATRDTLLAERQSIAEEFLAATSRWIAAARADEPVELKRAVAGREGLGELLRSNYWDLDPYIRARNCLDRTGVIQDEGRVEMYPSSKPSSQVQIRTAKILQVKYIKRERVRIVDL